MLQLSFGLLQTRLAKDKRFPDIPWWHGDDIGSVPAIPSEPRGTLPRPPPAPRLEGAPASSAHQQTAPE